MADAKRDNNRVTTLLAVSSVDTVTPVPIRGNPSTGGLIVEATLDTTGLATETKQDAGNLSLSNIDTKTPALGQALAASSVPIVLTAAQLSTLTPPAAITGFATSAKQDTQSGYLLGIGGLLTAAYDYISQVQASTTDTWTFKTGGSGGTTVATIVITYSDATKAVISNVAKT